MWLAVRVVHDAFVPAVIALVLNIVGLGLSGSVTTAGAQAAPCGGDVTQLIDSGFEHLAFGLSGPTFEAFPASEVPGRDTTETDQEIELWSHGFQGVRA